MKKIVMFAAMAISLIACNKTPEVKEFKTAYIDTQKLMEDYEEAKVLSEKFKTKGEVKGRELEVEARKLKAEESNFKQNAMAKGQAWAQQKYAELQQRAQQLAYAEQAIAQQLQMEGGVERDSVVMKVRDFIKAYGKEKGYDYIYGTGDAATVLYAKDTYDITKDVVKALNEKYAAKNKPAEKKEETKTAEKK
ncbi:OmpH family outer membrane protein [Flavobacterium luminosum]|uniref:OmpH family outer membrane protein n=1 Tax=Flavobacterium luminosum TaxID=2949086 RepID=A0ABT0TR37_9FLAO|nr:OmpH family outer membrane protein [Flavobacterium sp. HXWNR70]MCL9809963.1 OmpH family outer membrane protein [Flavobacterium sp. HXWNR70]